MSALGSLCHPSIHLACFLGLVSNTFHYGFAFCARKHWFPSRAQLYCGWRRYEWVDAQVKPWETELKLYFSNSPAVLGALSRIAGIELVPAMDVDIGHVNISVRDDAAAARAPDSDADDKPAFAWHTDSYAFVCVTMLSDCARTIGGETAIRTGAGEVLKFRGPATGTAVIMQGRYIEHQALKAFGGRERISMVTSLRPKSPFVRDETIIRPLLPITPKSTLYYQYAEYRLENLEERVRHQLKVMRQHKKANRDFDGASAHKFLLGEREFIDTMLEELEHS